MTESTITSEMSAGELSIGENQPKEMGLFAPLYNQEGRIGYVIAWILGVPAWILLAIFLIRGH